MNVFICKVFYRRLEVIGQLDRKKFIELLKCIHRFEAESLKFNWQSEIGGLK